MNFAKGFGLGVLVSYAITATGCLVLLAYVMHTDRKETNVNKKPSVYYGYGRYATKMSMADTQQNN